MYPLYKFSFTELETNSPPFFFIQLHQTPLWKYTVVWMRLAAQKSVCLKFVFNNGAIDTTMVQ